MVHYALYYFMWSDMYLKKTKKNGISVTISIIFNNLSHTPANTTTVVTKTSSDAKLHKCLIGKIELVDNYEWNKYSNLMRCRKTRGVATLKDVHYCQLFYNLCFSPCQLLI